MNAATNDRTETGHHAPLVSVVMPAYNAEAHIGRAIESVLTQTFRDFEFIIVNDGSTDGTVGIVKGCIDQRIVLIDRKENAGVANALNIGLDAARGLYIARMDADDESLPRRFERQVKFMQNNPNVGVCGTAMIVVKNKSRRIPPPPPPNRMPSACEN